MPDVKTVIVPSILPYFEAPPAVDRLEENRHLFRKGRLEFMGGPIIYEQGHGARGLENNERRILDSSYTYGMDEMARDLQVDVDEK